MFVSGKGVHELMYKTIRIVAVIVAAFSCPPWVFAFEGVVHFKSNYWEEESEFQYYSKDERNRIEGSRHYGFEGQEGFNAPAQLEVGDGDELEHCNPVGLERW
jgi:hypothetical protein